MVILKLLLYLFVLVLVVFLAYYTTKLVGKSAGGKQLGKSIREFSKSVSSKIMYGPKRMEKEIKAFWPC